MRVVSFFVSIQNVIVCVTRRSGKSMNGNESNDFCPLQAQIMLEDISDHPDWLHGIYPRRTGRAQTREQNPTQVTKAEVIHA